SVVRRGDERFSDSERMLAQGLADQTALALRTVRLVTDLKLANQLKSEFVSTMSHELRTPLNVIIGYTEIARDPHTCDAERAQLLDCIGAAGTELLDLVESTLEIGRIDAGRDEVRLETVPSPKFWAGLRKGCARMQHAEGVKLEWVPLVPDVTLV